jgi:hypothetical protein
VTTFHTKLGIFNKQSADEQIISEIRSILAGCNGIKGIFHFHSLHDGKSRKFLIEVDNYQNQNKAIELLGGLNNDCRAFGENSILLLIPD